MAHLAAVASQSPRHANDAVHCVLLSALVGCATYQPYGYSSYGGYPGYGVLIGFGHRSVFGRHGGYRGHGGGHFGGGAHGGGGPGH